MLAEREGFQTLSDFARAKTLCLQSPAICVAPEPAPAEVSPGDILIADQVRRLGVNLNQIAHVMNMLREPAPPDLVPLLIDIRRYMQLVWAREGL